MSLDDIIHQAENDVMQAKTLSELQDIKSKYLGKSGIITQLNKELWNGR